MKVIAVTQARLGSSRFPKKIFQTIKGISLLEIHIRRIQKARNVDSLIIATTNKLSDDPIISKCKEWDVSFSRGSENDVLDRFYNALFPYKPDYVVRLTSDCPLIDPKLIDHIISLTINGDFDYCSNTLSDTFPDGQDIEVFKFSALETAWKEAKLSSEREHVTPFIKNNSSFFNGTLFNSLNVECETENYKNVRITVDEPCDFEVIKMLINELGFESSWDEYSNLYLSSDAIFTKNNSILRNEGYLKSLEKDQN